MNDMPKVSIIMGVYNCKDEAQLIKSVDSILNQTVSDFEFLICNDGSSDKTLDELNKIAKKDPRIKILTYDNNMGIHHALNTCLKEAKGEYIARQDDDLSKPERLKVQLEFLDEYQEYAMVGTCADVFDDEGMWGEFLVPEAPKKEDFLWNSPFMHLTMMMRKTALLSGGQRSKRNKAMRRL